MTVEILISVPLADVLPVIITLPQKVIIPLTFLRMFAALPKRSLRFIDKCAFMNVCSVGVPWEDITELYILQLDSLFAWMGSRLD